MLRSCLQVRASERATTNKILKMPGLLNHITGTLDDIQALIPDQESLMKTIRMPRRMGEITDRLPAPQYDSAPFKRTNSQPNITTQNADGENKKLLSAQKSRQSAASAVNRVEDSPNSAKPHMSQLNLGR